MDTDYAPPDMTTPRRGPYPAMRLDAAIKQALTRDTRDASLWLPGPARERLAFGVAYDSHPFDMCLVAAQNKRADALHILLDIGYSPMPERLNNSFRDLNWPGLLHACAEAGLCGAIERLVSAIPIDAPAPMGWTAMLCAAACGQEEAALLLLRLGASPFASTRAHESALIVASMRDLGALSSALLAAGVDPLAADDQGLCALDHARRFGSPRCMAILEAFDIHSATRGAPSRPRPGL